MPEIPYSKCAFLLVTIQYEYPAFWHWKHRTKTFQFFTKEAVDGTYQWFPNQIHVPELIWNPTNLPGLNVDGSAGGRNEPMYTRLERYPFLEITNVIIETNIHNDSLKPIAINYLLKNIGGMPALHVSTEWKIWDLRRWEPPFRCWVNLYTNPIPEQDFMVSDANWKMTDFWRDEGGGTRLFDQVILNAFTLVGILHFEDVENHKFELIFTVAPTNDGFSVSYKELGGYFTNVEPHLNGINNSN